MSYQKYTNCGCGGGHSFTFNLVNIDLLNNIINEVNQLSLSNTVKELYINYFNQECDYNFNIKSANKHVVSTIDKYINNFIYPIEDKLKQYDTLKKQNLKEKLQDYMNENEYTKAAEKSGLRVKEVHHELFKTESEREQYNNSVQQEKRLGPEYSEQTGGKPPFVVYVFEKP